MPATRKTPARKTPARKTSARKTPTGKTATRKTSSARTSSAGPSARPRVTEAVRARWEGNIRLISRVKETLESTQTDLAAIRGTLRSGRRDLRKDVAKLLRDARRDVEKMNKAVRRDLEQLQKDLSSAEPKADRAGGRASRTTARTAPRKR
jgi:hypothetical protein